MNKYKGFTLIEFVIVIVLIGILSAVALPRFLDITGDAHTANVNGTAGAVASAINISHAKWLASGQPTTAAPIAGIDLTNSGNQDTGFNVSGWPNAASDGSADIAAATVIGGGGNDATICAQIMSNLLSASSVGFAGGASCGQDYCATYAGSTCTYTYQQDTGVARTITYDTSNGTVQASVP